MNVAHAPDRPIARLTAQAAQIAAVALAASLPWSTSATSVLAGVWAVLALASLPPAAIAREARRLRSAIVLALLLLLLVSAAWTVGTWRDAVTALGALAKLLAIPLIITQVARTPGLGRHMLIALAASVGALLLFSWAIIAWPAGPWPRMNTWGVPVKDYISQNVFFVLLASGCLAVAWEAWTRRAWWLVLAAAVVGLLAILNIFVVAAARSTLLFLPVLVIVFVVARTDSVRAALAALTAAVVLAALAWTGSAMVRDRLSALVTEVQQYQTERAETSAGFRLEWYIRSAEIIRGNPVLGVGVGGIRAAQEAEAKRLALDTRFVTSNPHNQILWTGVQLGLPGIALLLGMWWAHARAMGRGTALGAAGAVVVGQNVLFSLLNSHLTDFTAGWTYVVLAGTLMGVVARAAPDNDT